MKQEDHNAVPDSVLTKEFLSQFKTEDDVSKFLTKLHAQVLEKMLEGAIYTSETRSLFHRFNVWNSRPFR